MFLRNLACVLKHLLRFCNEVKSDDSLLSSNRSTILENSVEDISAIISAKFHWWAKVDLIN